MSSQGYLVESARRAVASLHGTRVNQHGGIYNQGVSFSFAKKVEIAAAYEAAKTANNGGNRPNQTALAAYCRVSRKTIQKVERELEQYGRVLNPAEIQANRDVPRGPGSKALDEIDNFVILFLYLQEPSRSLASYVDWLEFFYRECGT